MNVKTLVLTLCAALAPVAGARAEDQASKETADRATMTQKHERMAEMHRRAAECLKSAKSVEDCHDALMKEMPAKPGECLFMGKDCPMCGQGMKMRGKGRGMRPGRPGAPKDEAPDKDAK